MAGDAAAVKRFVPLSLWHVLIALWSTALAFLLLFFTGTTSLLSSLFGTAALVPIVEIAFFVLSGVFAVILWRFVSPPQKRLSKLLGFFLPFAIFIIFLI